MRWKTKIRSKRGYKLWYNEENLGKVIIYQFYGSSDFHVGTPEVTNSYGTYESLRTAKKVARSVIQDGLKCKGCVIDEY